jgi:DNA-binding NarL/FixJ family response regulator
MARVTALIPDLLFGSRVQSSLAAAGHEVELIPDVARLRDRLGDAAAPAAAVLVIDLTNDLIDGPALVKALSAEGALAQTRTLGFYAHVDTSVRKRAERAGFDLVIPRSRMSREGAELVKSLLSG